VFFCVFYIYIYRKQKIESVLPGRTFSRDGGSAPDAPEAGALCRSSDPLSGRSDSRVIVLCFRARTQRTTPVKAPCVARALFRSGEGRGQAACCSLTGDR
jgi:hypothetical protein